MHWCPCYKPKLSNILKSKDLAILAFQKNSRHIHQNQLKSSPVSERSAYPCKTMYAFPAHLWVTEFWPQIYSRPWIEANYSKFCAGPRMPKDQLSRVAAMARELMDATHFPVCSSGTSAASQTFTLTAASYWHWTSTSLHSIGFINSFSFFFSNKPKRMCCSSWKHSKMNGRVL